MSHRPDSNGPRTFWNSVVVSRLSDPKIFPPSCTTEAEIHPRQALNDEIAAMSVALSGLKERRNAFFCKPNFPTEVLEHIFAYAALNEIPGQGRTVRMRALGSFHGRKTVCRAAESKICEILGWAKLTHVCRKWRAIALADANRWLWSTMDTGRLSATGMREILERSCPHPVTPRITLSVHPDETVAFAVLLEPQHLSRLKSLRIAGDDGIHPGYLTKSRDMWAHQHEMLCMLRRNPRLMIEALVVEYDQAGDRAFFVPCDLFAPQLRHLKLRNAELLGWNTNTVTYPQLTHLEVTGRPGMPIRFTMATFLKWLRGSPHLQVLRLGRHFLAAAPAMFVDNERMETLKMRVDLLQLKELSLHGPLYECTLLGWYLNVPDSCPITIDAVGSKDGMPPYRVLGPVLQHWAQSPVRLDTFSGHHRFPVGIKVWTAIEDTQASAGGSRVIPDAGPPRLHLTLTAFPAEPRWPQVAPAKGSFWETLYGALSLEQLVDLRVYARNEADRRPLWWRQLFRSAGAVRHVWVDGGKAVKDLVYALDPSAPAPLRQRTGWGDQPLFPELKSLTLRWFDFDGLGPGPDLMDRHDLRNCLQARKDVGLCAVDVQFECSDRMLPFDFEASLAELEGLGTFHIK